MKNLNHFIVAVFLSVVSLFGCAVKDEDNSPPLLYQLDGSEMTIQLLEDPLTLEEFVAEDLNGRSVSSADWRGKVTLVNFWATWCKPCLIEIPDLIKLQERYSDYLQIIGVSMDEAPVEYVQDFVREHGINYPVVMNTPEIRHAFPGVYALPTSFVLDAEVRMVQKHVGLIKPNVLEQETRVLASLSSDAIVENVTGNGQLLLSDAAHATEIPGVDLSQLTPEQRTAALLRLNADSCSCGCQLTLAQCRINDSACGFSLPLAEAVVAEIANSEL